MVLALWIHNRRLCSYGRRKSLHGFEQRCQTLGSLRASRLQTEANDEARPGRVGRQRNRG